MATRARAFTVSNLENLLDNNQQQAIKGKQVRISLRNNCSSRSSGSGYKFTTEICIRVYL